MRQHPMHSILVSVFVLFPFSFFLFPFLSAQERPTFRSNAELVVLHVSVRDRGGRYISGLTKDAFNRH